MQLSSKYIISIALSAQILLPLSRDPKKVTVGSWHARWSDRVAEHDLETLFWQWGERFPSLAGMERWQWQDMPFWQVIAEAGMAAREAGHAVREMERWMVPNKLREVA